MQCHNNSLHFLGISPVCAFVHLCGNHRASSTPSTEYPGDIEPSLEPPSAVNERMESTALTKFIITALGSTVQINNWFVRRIFWMIKMAID